jgi:hypothetical protein
MVCQLYFCPALCFGKKKVLVCHSLLVLITLLENVSPINRMFVQSIIDHYRSYPYRNQIKGRNDCGRRMMIY